MIDINTPAARAKLATLPDYVRGNIQWMHGKARSCQHTAEQQDGFKRRRAGMQAAIWRAALYAAIVEAFEPLAAHDHSADVARILGGDV